MEYRETDGRYLVTRKVHWMAIFRILVDRGIYPDGTDYRGFCHFMEGVCPADGYRVPLSYQSLKGISRTMYVRPFAEWRYDTVYMNWWSKSRSYDSPAKAGLCLSES